MSLPPPSSVAMESGQFSLGEFSSDERRLLLGLAHDAILSRLERREIGLDPPTDHLNQPRGAFTTLYLHGELRGCVGITACEPGVSRCRRHRAPPRSKTLDSARHPARRPELK
jgi:hypothetical protein